MRNRTAVFLLYLLAYILAGCGGGGMPPATEKRATGKATFTIVWPAHTRLIPDASNSIAVAISQATTTLTQKVLARPAAGATATVTFAALPVTTLSVTATAYPNADGTGTAQATATLPLLIQANQTTSLSLTMNSTIDHLELTPSSTTMTVGDSLSLAVAAKDASGAVVLLSPAKLQWLSSNTAAASVDTNGEVTGVAVGSADISVTDKESSKSAKARITVAAAIQQSVAYQIDAAHSGHAVFGQPLTFPSAPTWSVDLGGAVSYPLIAGGMVYVLSNNGGLYALNKTTGKVVWGPISAGRAFAYDRGKLFLVSLGGTLISLDAVTGRAGWSVQLPGQYNFSASPTAVNGIVYEGGAGSGGTLYAVDETNGALLWTASVENGDQSSPAVSKDGVFVSYPCQVYKFDPNTGASLWHYSGPCEGGGGKTAAYANGLLYVRDGGGTIFDAATGAQVGSFSAGRIPAIGATTGYFQDSGTLRAINLSTHQVLWSFAGDGQINSAPLLIDQTVIIGSGSGTVYALNATTGQLVWSGSAGAPIPAPDEQNLSQSLTGFGAGEGYLVVAAGNRLTAWHITGP